MVKHLFIIEGADDWLEDTCKKIDEGMNIIVFPMGGRHKKDQRPRIHRGASLIAYRSHKDIYVLHIYNSFEFLQKGVPAYESDYKVIDYNVSYVDKINTQEFLDKYNDEITFKTELTKCISKKVYIDEK